MRATCTSESGPRRRVLKSLAFLVVAATFTFLGGSATALASSPLMYGYGPTSTSVDPDTTVWANVLANESEALDLATVNTSTFYLKDLTSSKPVQAAVSVERPSIGERKIVLTPYAPLELGHKYRATILNAIRNVQGLSLTFREAWNAGSSFSWEFTIRSLSFSDVPEGHPYRVAIYGLAAKGAVSGYGDGDFGPSDALRRMQFAKMIALTLSYQVTEEDVSRFKDVPTGLSPADPLYPDHYIAVAERVGLIKGYPDDTFRPMSDIIRAQVITMVVRSLQYLPDPPDGWRGALDYSDPTHGENIRKAEYNGLLKGLVGLSASWNSGQYASRGECAQLLWNRLHYSGPQPDGQLPFSDDFSNPESGWAKAYSAPAYGMATTPPITATP